jgi:hypothetical protein
MAYYLFKIAVTTALVVIISEVAKRSSLIGAILASVPIVSVLAMFWLYIETKNLSQISSLSTSIFWLVLPTLILFLALPVLLKLGLNFYLAMALATGLTVGCYFLMVLTLGHFGVKL